MNNWAIFLQMVSFLTDGASLLNFIKVLIKSHIVFHQAKLLEIIGVFVFVLHQVYEIGPIDAHKLRIVL